MAHPNLWGTTDTRNGLPTTTRESPDFSHGECQNIDKYSEEFIDFFEAQLKQIGMILYKNELFKNLGIVKNIKGAGYPNLEKIFREICFQIDKESLINILLERKSGF